MWEVIMVALSALASLTIVGRAAEGGLFNSALTRTVAGGSAAVATQTFLYGYTNLDSFIQACINGSIGLAGYLFVAAIIFTAGVWVNNLIAYRQAIV
jgi:hypothetical protein